ncbi:MAG: ArdC-like ssDNA-binding domain-containing protein [Gammaproteobacteria bacterium]
MQVQQLYAEITARIIEGLEQGVKPWQRGWDADVPLALPRNALTGKEYRGSNVLWLWFVMLGARRWRGLGSKIFDSTT